MTKKKKSDKTVYLERCGGRFIVTPMDNEVYEILESELRFTDLQFNYGEAAKKAKEAVTAKKKNLYLYDKLGRLGTSYGFYKRVQDVLTANGYKSKIRNHRPHKHPEIYNPDWDQVYEFATPRYKQEEIILQLALHDYGRISCPTGYGKSFLIALLTRAYWKAKIDIVAPDADVVRNLYDELVNMIPGVGLIGAGCKTRGNRVQLYCAKSLHHSDADADILLADEVHKLASDGFIKHLVRYQNSRNFGFSATHNMRLDGKDERLEGLFGPIIMHLTYQECVDEGLIVPIIVLWRDVLMDRDPCEGLMGYRKEVAGIYGNQWRNHLVAEDARVFPDDEQVLITVRKIEHAAQLKKLLPEYTLVHNENGMDWKSRTKLIRRGLLKEDEPIMSQQLRNSYRKNFESGKLKKVIATSVWDQGVNFKGLSVLIRADAMGSPILDSQIPGRTSRLFPEKDYGIIIDYCDQFNKAYKQKAGKRRKSYKENEWEQISQKRTGGQFRQSLLF